jgi:hypothetical protein
MLHDNTLFEMAIQASINDQGGLNSREMITEAIAFARQHLNLELWRPTRLTPAAGNCFQLSLAMAVLQVVTADGSWETEGWLMRERGIYSAIRGIKAGDVDWQWLGITAHTEGFNISPTASEEYPSDGSPPSLIAALRRLREDRNYRGPASHLLPQILCSHLGRPILHIWVGGRPYSGWILPESVFKARRDNDLPPLVVTR